MGFSTTSTILRSEYDYLQGVSHEERTLIIEKLQVIVGENINIILSSIERGSDIYDYLTNVGFHSDTDINHTKYQITISDFLIELSKKFSDTFQSLIFENIQHVTKNFIVNCTTKRGAETELGKNKTEGIHFYNEVNSQGEIGYIKLPIVNGEYFYVSINIKSSNKNTINLHHKADIVGLYNYFQAHSEYIHQSCELIDAKYVDSLTGLYNVGFAKQILSEKKGKGQISENKEKENGEYYSLIFFDVADFKTINDVYGHVVGDKVLEEIGKILKNTMRPGDYAVRLGGDEMGLIINNLSEENTDVIQEKLDKIQKRLHHQLSDLNVFGIKISVVTSSSISTKDTFKDLETLKIEADSKLIKGQDGKVNRISEFLLQDANDDALVKILNILLGSQKASKFSLPVLMQNIQTIEYFIYEIDNNPEYRTLMNKRGISDQSIENAELLARPLLHKFHGK